MLRRITGGSIVRRLTWLFWLSSVVILCAIGLHLYDSLDRQLQARDEEELRGKVELVRNLLRSMESAQAVSMASQRWQDAFVGHQGLSLNLFDRNLDRLIAVGDRSLPSSLVSTRVPKYDAPLMFDWLADETGHSMHLATAWGWLGDPQAQPILVALTLDRAEQQVLLAAHLRHTLIAVGFGAVAAALLGYLVSRSSLRPVLRIAADACEIHASGLNRRLDAAATPVELGQMVAAFNAMLARLEESFRRLSDFSSDLAHEFRTPINNLIGQSQVGLARTRSETELREIIASNIEECERLARMVDDLLFLARADNAQAVLCRESFPISEEILKSLAYFEGPAEERHVRLHCQGDATIVADRGMTRRALVNLISNAIRHSPANARVSIVAQGSTDGAVSVSVSNDGPGIPSEHLARVFDRFYRVDSARARSEHGSGLGLAIVKSIVSLHGGQVRVDSNAHGLTTFTLFFPPGEVPRTPA